MFHVPWTILSSCSWSSVYGMVLTEVARGLCLWVSIYTRFLEEGSDVHLRAQFLSPFHWFFSWQFLFFLVATLGSSNLRPQCRNCTPSASTSWIHFQFHLCFFYIFVNGDGKLIAPWQTRHFFELLWTSQMYKAGIPPIHNNFHHFRQRVRTR